MKDKVAINLAKYPARKAAKKGPRPAARSRGSHDGNGAPADWRDIEISRSVNGPRDRSRAKVRQISRQPALQLLNSLADLVRSMNCYYSNLIEGHNTHPVRYRARPQKRLQQGTSQAQFAARGEKPISPSKNGLMAAGCEAGALFPKTAFARFIVASVRNCQEELLWVEDPDTKERIKIVPGELRRRDVKVGNHVPISPGAMPRFLKRFEHVYGHSARPTPFSDTAPGTPSGSCGFTPFQDGNGRVARLMSHAVLLETLDTGAVWSAARGLARKVAEYKRHLTACDSPRRNDLDGRGALSEEALAAFTKFFLEVCVRPSGVHGGIDAARCPARTHSFVGGGTNQIVEVAAEFRPCTRSRTYRGTCRAVAVASVAGASTRTATPHCFRH